MMTDTGTFASLFTHSPFSLTANRLTAACWSGRPEILDRLHRLTRSFKTRADSSLDIIWANFGAGKSHTFYHLAYLVSEASFGQRVIPVQIEMPEQIRHFLDLYQSFMTNLPLKKVAEAIVNAADEPIRSDLRQAANAILHGGATERDIAEQWLRGERPHASDLRRCGINRRIEDDVMATAIFSNIIAALAGSGTRLLIMIDEFQRISVLGPKTRAAVLSNIRSIFSNCPIYLSVIFAVTSRIEQHAMDLLPPELKTLLGGRPPISLPEMDIEEEIEFVKGRFDFFRPVGYSGDPYAPFTQETVRTIIDYLAVDAEVSLIPRHILQAMAGVFDETFDDGKLITPDQATTVLHRMTWQG